MTTNDPFGICLEENCEGKDTPEQELPSTMEMMRNLFKSSKAIIGGVLAHEGMLVFDDVFERRMSICKECPFFIQESKRCSKCGCFMEKKAMFKKTECPIGKWKPSI